MVVARKESSDPSVQRFEPSAALVPRLQRFVRTERVRRACRRYAGRGPAGAGSFRDDRNHFGDALLPALPDGNLINLHAVAGFIDYWSFFPKVPLNRITVWTLHDMEPFTGGCDYDDGCGRFALQCGACPQLDSQEENDLSRQIWSRKKQAMDHVPAERLHLVATSHWMAEQAARSAILKKFPLTMIPNGVDTEVLRPVPGSGSLRRSLEIAPDTRILLYVNDGSDECRKNIALLGEALTHSASSDTFIFLSLGHASQPPRAGIPHRHIGAVSNDGLRAAIYSMADIFVLVSTRGGARHPAREAMACGTPVAAFNAGGICDIVKDGESGCCVPGGDIPSLANALLAVVDDPMRRAQMKQQARRQAVEDFSLKEQARRYRQLYGEISQPAEIQGQQPVSPFA